MHSPFVFDLLTKCFYDKRKYPEYEILKSYRNELLRNKDTIEVTDFGVGSKVFNSDTRAIHQIAKNAGISGQRAQLLFRIMRYFKPESVLELGTSLGLAAQALALGNKNSVISTLEGCAATAKIAQIQFALFDLNNINSFTAEFKTYLNSSALASNKFQLIYFDGNHSEAATLHYFKSLLPTICNETVWIFDDIHWSKDMENAWETIKNHPEVIVTIDTFHWGFVFFRKEQKKEHFVIRT